MAKRYDNLKIMDQIIKKMEDHNLAEVEIKDLIHIKKGRPQDAVELIKQSEINDKRAKEAEELATIRLNDYRQTKS